LIIIALAFSNTPEAGGNREQWHECRVTQASATPLQSMGDFTVTLLGTGNRRITF
jgi:hypothetical protein